MRKLVTAAVVTVAAAVLSLCTLPAPAQARYDLGPMVLRTAETRAGMGYSYGADGPYRFDCSGLVYWAAAQHGIHLPRETWGMERSGYLERIPLADVRAGDLLFFNGGEHVEFASGRFDQTFGAHDWGQPVGWIYWGSQWYTAVAYRIV